MIVMTPIDLDIDMLRCFMEVAKTGNFTMPGNNFGLTQSGEVYRKLGLISDYIDLTSGTAHSFYLRIFSGQIEMVGCILAESGGIRH